MGALPCCNMVKTQGRAALLCPETGWRHTKWATMHINRFPSSSLAARTPSSFSSFFGSQAVLKLSRSSRKIAALHARGALQTQAAIFGVGAPEVIVVGVVALLVFGPKGLAQAAKSLGSALRSFQPTIRELAEVSTDLKSTLEKEIGIDELRDDIRAIRSPLAATPPQPTMRPEVDPPRAGSGVVAAEPITESIAQEIDPAIEAKRKEAANLAWGGQSPDTSASEDVVKESGSLSSLSVAELEAELARRRAEDIDGKTSNEV